MIAGLSVSAFTELHVVISLIAIASGFVVLAAMIGSRPSPGWTALFLTTTVATSVTGFMFHSTSIGPPHVVGAISLVVLAVAIHALYVRRLAGIWRTLHVGGAVLALYLNVFVAVVQAFQKLTLLQPLAPTQTEPPFLVTQIVVLLLFVVAGIVAVRRFPQVQARTA